MLDLYCERLAPGLWAEPLNALSNLAFFVAAWASWRWAHLNHASSPSVSLLIAVVATVGTGSLLFHTFATPWARFLDVAPILLFQILFLWIYIRQIAGIGIVSAASLCVVLGMGVYLSAQFPHRLNGSLEYFPAFVVLLMLGGYHWSRGKIERIVLLWATVVFGLALVFRTIDNAVCPYFATGTHFLWHLLNSLVLYLLIRSIIVNTAPEMTGAPVENRGGTH